MKKLRCARALVLWACAGLVLPPTSARADGPAIHPSRVNAALAIQDVALGEKQSFEGIVLNESGKPVVDGEVTISQLGRDVARAKTDTSGRFRIDDLRAGLHVVRCGEGEGLYRFWAPGTAPPHAKSRITLVDKVMVRGQRPFRELLTSNTVILVGVVAAAIAIPIAVHDARNDKKSGS